MRKHPRASPSSNWKGRQRPYKPREKFTRYDEASSHVLAREMNTLNDRIKHANAELHLLYRSRNINKELMFLEMWIDAVDAGDADPNAGYGPQRITYVEAVRRVNNYLLGRLRASLHAQVYKGRISEREYWAIVRCFDHGKV